MKQRNIFLWYLISLVTLGIGGIVWYYHLNADAKKLSQDPHASPATSLLAVTLGSVIIIPLYVSLWGTWSRVREATSAEGLGGWLQFCLVFVPFVNIAYSGYLQSKLNRAIGAAAEGPAAAPVL